MVVGVLAELLTVTITNGAGPVGCGKSTTIEVLARAAGYEISEWTPPVPTLWSEFQYQVEMQTCEGQV